MRKYIIITFCGLIFVSPAFSADAPVKASINTSANATVSTNTTANTTTASAPAETGYSTSELGQPPAEGVAILPQGIVKQIPLQPEPVLKRIDISRIGSAPNYETFSGLRLGKYFTIAQRVEIYQEPRPVDTYIMDAKKIRYENTGMPWNNKADFRSQIQPIFTRAYGTEITMSDPKNKEGQIRYTHDYREIYQNQFPIYWQAYDHLVNDNYSHEYWDQNEILFMHAKRIPGIEWYETINLGYRYSTMRAKNDGATDAYYENRHTYFTNFSLAPNERCEFFGQFEYFKSNRRECNSFAYNPDHYLYAGELRMKTRDLKTSVIPRVSWSEDFYFPFRNTYQKYEFSVRIGHDYTPKLQATDTIKANFGFRDEPDNQAPDYINSPYALRHPIHDMAGFVGNELRVQYNFYDRLWYQGGFDLAAGTNMSDFDNVGILTGLEYYSPGMIRVDVGYQGNDYYNLSKDSGELGKWLSSIYFKVYLFM